MLAAQADAERQARQEARFRAERAREEQVARRANRAVAIRDARRAREAGGRTVPANPMPMPVAVGTVPEWAQPMPY